MNSCVPRSLARSIRIDDRIGLVSLPPRIVVLLGVEYLRANTSDIANNADLTLSGSPWTGRRAAERGSNCIWDFALLTVDIIREVNGMLERKCSWRARSLINSLDRFLCVWSCASIHQVRQDTPDIARRPACGGPQDAVEDATLEFDDFVNASLVGHEGRVTKQQGCNRSRGCYPSWVDFDDALSRLNLN